jgi:hypothetical protein
VEILIAAVLIGLIPAAIAQKKGYSFIGYWVFGALLFIVALPVTLLMKPNPAKFKQCAACRSQIDRQASVCPNCGTEQDWKTKVVQ